MDKNYKREYYNKYISVMQKLLEFEPERIKIRNKYILTFGVFFAVLFAVFGWFIRGFQVQLSTAEFVAMIFVLPFVICWIIAFISYVKNKLIPQYKSFKKSVKETCFKDLLKTFDFIKIKECSNFKDLKKILDASNIFTSFDSIMNDDCFVGKYSDAQFNVCESVLNIDIKSTRPPYATYHLPCYKGIILCYQFNKPILSNTIVTSKWDFANRNIIPYIWLMLGTAVYAFVCFACIFAVSSSISDFILFFILAFFIFCFVIFLLKNFFKAIFKYKKIKLEDVKFDKRFNVYSDNQVEARYLLTPSFMERFINLQTAFGTKKIKCSFIGDKIVFAISTNKDLFEIGHLFTPMKSSKQIEKLYNEIVSIIEMIDYFKLNERTRL